MAVFVLYSGFEEQTSITGAPIGCAIRYQSPWGNLSAGSPADFLLVITQRGRQPRRTANQNAGLPPNH